MQQDDDVDKDELFGKEPLLPNDPPLGDRARQPNKIQFSWNLGKDNAPRGSPSPAHRAALELLQSMYNKHAARSWEQEKALREIKDLLSSQATEFSVFEQWMEPINYLVSKHGSVADAVEQALAGGAPPTL
jgi:hypothetical protein